MQARSVERIVDRHRGRKTALISILHEIQDRCNHLPEDALKKVAARLGMDYNEIYGVATFYRSFTLTPRGKNKIILCLGTACHVRGGPKVVREVKSRLGVEAGGTTPDGRFTLEVVNCLGVCAIGPVMIVNGEIHGEMTPAKARKAIQALGKKGNGGKA
ncbi:MAG TPA: NAD(P)H-dependent oxidoreductase subunit E [Thermodesulfobacteriota bacterium]|nr:NAD(P)H-dependent oxidoreductase subunit E [Thermodesulfobacteriota bacterium]